MRNSLFIILLSIFAFSASGQDSRLANQYYQSGEYEKAASVYKALFDKNYNSHFYFQRYLEAIMAMEDYELAEEEIKKQLKKKPDHMQLYVDYGNLLDRQFKHEEADKQYQKAINNIPPDISVINNLGNAFTRLTKFDMAIEAYLKGGEMLGNDVIFAYNLADLYKRKGEVPLMIKYYITASTQHANQIERYKTYFQRNLQTDEDLEEMRRQLYERIQEDEDNVIYPELLEWVFIEKEDYRGALRQARSLDRKYEEDGSRVMNIGDIAYDAKDYTTAIKAYDYVTANKSLNNRLYVTAKRSILKCKKNQITRNYDYTEADLDSLKKEYVQFIDEFGVNNQTERLVKEYADFLAVYKNDLDGSIDVLKELIALGSISKNVKANSKIALADYYLMQGDVWESTLLYSQVEKDFKEEYIGEVSRFKNAKLSYFTGNFAWAKEQFSILKTATSRLISNDAIDLSIFILDNMGLDTTDIPLKMFAQSELLTYQNKFDEAFAKLDSITTLYPEHALEDDILYQKANLHLVIKEYDEAKELYTVVYEKFPEEIRADNALFNLAELYENQLEQPDKAKELYEKLFIDFSNSTFAIEARKRYRILRGDNIQ